MEEGTMNAIPKPRFDRTLNYGNVIQIILLAIMIAGGGIYLVKWQAATDSRITAVEAAAKPMSEMILSNQRQDDRLDRVEKGLDNILDIQREAAKALGEISTSIAVIEERTKKETAN